MSKRSKTDRAARAETDPAASVLVVGEDQDACELLCRVISGTGTSAVSVRDAEGAVDALAGMGAISAIVLNLTGGADRAGVLLDVIRLAAKHPMPAVIVIAAGSTDGTSAPGSGADELLTRPFHVEALTDAVSRMTSLSRAELEVRRARPQNG